MLVAIKTNTDVKNHAPSDVAIDACRTIEWISFEKLSLHSMFAAVHYCSWCNVSKIRFHFPKPPKFYWRSFANKATYLRLLTIFIMYWRRRVADYSRCCFSGAKTTECQSNRLVSTTTQETTQFIVQVRVCQQRWVQRGVSEDHVDVLLTFSTNDSA